MLVAPAKAADGVDVGLAEAVAGAVAVLVRADVRQGRRGRDARRGQRGHGLRLLDLGRAEAEQLGDAGRGRARLPRADDRVLKAPAPAVACARHGRADPMLGLSQAPCPYEPAGSSPAARGAPTRSRSTGATITTTRRPRARGRRRRDRRAARARLAQPRRPVGPPGGPRGARRAPDPAPAAAALGAAPRRGRRVAVDRGAVRHARGRRALARRPPRAVAVVLAGALGARRRRRRRRRREPGRHADARARRGVVGRPRARPGRGARAACRTGS